MGNEVEVFNPLQNQSFVPVSFQKANQVFTSLDNADKAGILRAMGNADYNLLNWCLEHTDEPVMMKDVLFHKVQVADEETGELHEQVRTVIVDIDGVTYSAVSAGAISSLQNLFTVFEIQPPFEQGFPITAKLVPTRKFKTMQIVPWEDPASKAKRKKK